MLAYTQSRALPAHCLLTKADKLGRGEQSKILHAVRKQLRADVGDGVSAQLYSGESKQGVDEARAVVAGWLQL
jgi:GTP-binding protein